MQTEDSRLSNSQQDQRETPTGSKIKTFTSEERSEIDQHEIEQRAVFSQSSILASKITQTATTSEVRKQHKFKSCLRHNSSLDTFSESLFRRSLDVNETNDTTLYSQYGEEYQDFQELVDEQDFRESSVSSESSTVSDSRILKITRSESGGSPLIRKRIVINEAGEQIEVIERPKVRIGSAAIQRATESCPNSPLSRKVKQSYFSEQSVEESDETLVASSLDSTMEEQQQKKFYYELSDNKCESRTVSIGEHINVKEVQRRQEVAQSSMAEMRQRVILTESVATSSREGTPTRVPFERSVSAVATVKRTDSSRSSSGLSISQRDILVNRSRSWNAIEANLFTSSVSVDSAMRIALFGILGFSYASVVEFVDCSGNRKDEVCRGCTRRWTTQRMKRPWGTGSGDT